MKISFDFDGTLARPHIQEYAKELIDRGLEVWIVTSRFDDENYAKHHFTNLHKGEPANKDLYEVAKELGIPEDRIYFTNMCDKYEFLKDKEFIWHLDDDWIENKLILKNTKTKAIDAWGNSSWKQKCERILTQYNKKEN